MTVETSAHYINELNETYPKKEDLIKEGDDHLRLIKYVLKSTFPSVTSAINITSTKLNYLDTAFTIPDSNNVTFNSNIKFTSGKSIDFNNTSPVNLGSPSNNSSPITLGYFKTELMKLIYPVGCLHITTGDTNPGITLGIGTWSKYGDGRVLLCSGTGIDERGVAQAFPKGQTGGEYFHKIIYQEMPTHDHTYSGISTSSYGGDHSHYFCNDDHIGSAPIGNYGITRISDFGTGGSSGGGSLWLYSTNSTGGHSHSFNYSGSVSYSGGDVPHNNIQPYVVVNVWRRVS